MAQRAAAIAVIDAAHGDADIDATADQHDDDDDVVASSSTQQQEDTRPAPRVIGPSAASVGARLAAAKATMVSALASCACPSTHGIIPTAANPLPTTHSQAPTIQRAATGQFPRLPVVPPAHELITTALKRAERVAVPKTVKNEAQRAKARTARLLDTLTKEVSVPLGVLLKGFPPPHTLHPFETALLQLTVGEERYVKTLMRVRALRKSVVEVGKGHAGRAAKCATKKEALVVAEEGMEAVQRVYTKVCPVSLHLSPTHHTLSPAHHPTHHTFSPPYHPIHITPYTSPSPPHHITFPPPHIIRVW